MTKHTINLDAFGTMEMESIVEIMQEMIKEGKRGRFEHSKKINFDDQTGQVWRSGFKNK